MGNGLSGDSRHAAFAAHQEPAVCEVERLCSPAGVSQAVLERGVIDCKPFQQLLPAFSRGWSSRTGTGASPGSPAGSRRHVRLQTAASPLSLQGQLCDGHWLNTMVSAGEMFPPSNPCRHKSSEGLTTSSFWCVIPMDDISLPLLLPDGICCSELQFQIVISLRKLQ